MDSSNSTTNMVTWPVPVIKGPIQHVTELLHDKMLPLPYSKKPAEDFSSLRCFEIWRVGLAGFSFKLGFDPCWNTRDEFAGTGTEAFRLQFNLTPTGDDVDGF